jgi:hypothetical protein
MNVLFLSPFLELTLIEPCFAADNYEIIEAISGYTTLEYTHQAILLDNKNNKAKLCQVTISLGAVLDVKSKCVDYASYNNTYPAAGNIQSVSNYPYTTSPHDTAFDGIWRLNKNSGLLEYCVLRFTPEPIVYNGNAFNGDSRWMLGCLPL